MNSVMYKILLVDDDVALCELLCEFLNGEGFATSAVHSGQAALESIKTEGQYDALVLDIMMPEMSGLEVLQLLRQRVSTPVIMLTGRGDDIDRIVGLEMGADDYLGKPCNPRELAARLKAVLRRTGVLNRLDGGSTGSTILSLHGIKMDVGRREASVDAEPLAFTSAEFNTLEQLMASAGKVLSKEYLTDKVLHRKLGAYDRSIDVHVSRIRQKLTKAGKDPALLKTVRGAGYQFVSAENSDVKAGR